METTPSAGIALRDLHVPAYNPRRVVHDDAEYADFKASIRSHGILQPILARAVAGKKTRYEVVAGQRRFLASLEVFGQDYVIPALVMTEAEMNDEQAEAAAAAENIDRSQMSPAEEAEAAARVLARCNGNRAEAAKRMGWSPANLDNRLKLMACSEMVRTRLTERKMNIGLAEMLSGLTTAKQDELLAIFDKSGMPTIDDAKAMILSLTKALPTAIFDRAECSSCAHNSAQQQAMFGNIDEGHCLNASCYDAKTEAQLQATVDALKGDFQRVEIVRTGDNFRVIALKAEFVGEDQAKACRGCKDYGAAVSALPNKLGKVSQGLCFGVDCNAEKVELLKAAQAEAVKAASTESATASSAPASAKAPDAKAPAKDGKADKAAKGAKPPVVVAKPTIGLSNAVLEFRDELYRRVVYKEFATNAEFNARFVMAIVLNSQGRIFKGDVVQKSFAKSGLIQEGDSVIGLSHAMKVMMAIPTDRASNMLPNLGASAITELTRHELKDLTSLAKADLTKYFVFNDESGKKLLASLTKSEIIAICEELGIAEKMGKTFRSISGGKKDEFIKQITSVAGFEYQGKLPNVLKPDFEK